jgi:hypothetical protein
MFDTINQDHDVERPDVQRRILGSLKVTDAPGELRCKLGREAAGYGYFLAINIDTGRTRGAQCCQISSSSTRSTTDL